ncbi:phosphatase PAP2 family protein [Azoarcus sp. DN11]|uniref:phosphatase PAP2 family protein n=1 Tax=Azoarcus sp. DN11 TaxID=356837 RepID=UPI000EAC2913|nr:phosphatase PAP2 family protein [Azoarcus sp. DN11]AYH45626.1 hypothetical protein CDA09_19950 [Azoarcus sp. DN11]
MSKKQSFLRRFPEPLAILALLAVDATWIALTGIEFRNYSNTVIAASALLIVSIFYGVTARSRRLSEMSYYGALWVSFSATGAVLTYLAAYMRVPLHDAQFVSLDAEMGFHWLAWLDLIHRHPVIETLLTAAYYSLFLQIFGSIVIFSHHERKNRNFELFCTSSTALVITSAAAYYFPAAGAFHYFNIDLERAVHLPHLLALIEGTRTSFSFTEMQGIVTFPSFHAAMAIIFIYVHRGHRILFPLLATLNVLMLIATPINGGHYLVDIIAGSLVAAASIAILRYSLSDLRGAPKTALQPQEVGVAEASPTAL